MVFKRWVVERVRHARLLETTWISSKNSGTIFTTGCETVTRLKKCKTVKTTNNNHNKCRVLPTFLSLKATIRTNNIGNLRKLIKVPTRTSRWCLKCPPYSRTLSNRRRDLLEWTTTSMPTQTIQKYPLAIIQPWGMTCVTSLRPSSKVTTQAWCLSISRSPARLAQQSIMTLLRAKEASSRWWYKTKDASI